jgi:hypothetical protein
MNVWMMRSVAKEWVSFLWTAAGFQPPGRREEAVIGAGEGAAATEEM